MLYAVQYNFMYKLNIYEIGENIMKKKLYKSDNRVLAGVLGGIANYLNVDPTVIRVIFVILTMLTSIVPCVIFYVIAAMIMPDMPNFSQYEREDVTPNQDDEI